MAKHLVLCGMVALLSTTPALAESPLDTLKVGSRAIIATHQLSVTGVIETVNGDFLYLKTGVAAKSIAIRKSAIETFQLVADEPAPGGTPRRALVYVHGICAHPTDYWKEWWASMQPYAPSIDATRIEGVYWSDIVNDAPGGTPSVEEVQIKDQIRGILNDRMQQDINGVPEPAPGGPVGTAIGCADDFVQYMQRERIRELVLARFDAIVDKHLSAGTDIDIISHSWGTVVAYEGLRRKDGKTYPGKVRNLFTVGSALSIQPVAANLRTRVADGKRPKLVANWVNLDAYGDIVGGRISGLGFAPDVERLGLPAVGCSFIPLPTCAHSSYFAKDNVNVNRDIFGYFISR